MSWQPIDSAPKDGPWLVWSSAYKRPIVVMHKGDDGTFWEDDWEFDVRATHWMPLPAPPGEDQGIPVYASRDATDDVLGKP